MSPPPEIVKYLRKFFRASSKSSYSEKNPRRIDEDYFLSSAINKYS